MEEYLADSSEQEEKQALETGRLLFAKEAKFFFGAQRLNQLEPAKLPEVAFAGRSNVGKSSLINAITGQKMLARASSDPGRTKQLNFFDVGGRLVLVDMPGYGYARASKAVKDDWQRMMFSFLRGRPSLQRVLFLLDGKIEVKQIDLEVMKLLNRAAVTFQIVLTKCDGLSVTQLEAKEKEITALIRNHTAAYPHISITSGKTNLGIERLRADLACLAK